METRVLTSISGTITDISSEVNNYYSQTPDVTLDTTDYIFIGQRHPFNHIYFKFGTLNVNELSISVSLWDGSTWKAVSDLIDETSGFTSNGFITFTPSKYDPWSIEDTVDSNGNDDITGITGVNIYDRYWIRIGVSATMSESTIKWIGNIFSNDNDLKSKYPELVKSAYLTAWESGKTTWEEQHVQAAEQVISDMIRKNVITYKGQILEREVFKIASVHATAEIIYSGLGDDYEDNRLRAYGKYSSELKKGVYDVDKNKDGRLDKVESKTSTGKITR